MGKKADDTSQAIKISNGRRLVLCLYSEIVVFTKCVRPLRDKKVRLTEDANRLLLAVSSPMRNKA